MIATELLVIDNFTIRPGDVYYLNDTGRIHREDGPAIENTDGTKRWCQNGVYHRVDGPAYCANGAMVWFFNGKRHRVDGPASIGPGGYKAWWLHGVEIHRFLKIPNEDKWTLIKGDPENIRVIWNPTLKMQEYVIKHRPDLVGLIQGLDDSLRVKYCHEAELAGVDL